jgi:hypothetical protein
MQAMPYDSHKIRTSILTLKEFYSGVLALALYEAIRGVAEMPNALGTEQFRFFLFAFCTTLVPFYHGIMRYFDDNYLSSSREAQPSSFMLDYLLFCILGGLLVWMGAIFGDKFDPDRFILVYGALLSVDIIWGVLAHFLTNSFNKVKVWLALNVIVVMALCLLWAWSHPFQGRQITMFLFIAPFRSIGDYWLNWEMYFPKVKEIEPPKVEPPKVETPKVEPAKAEGAQAGKA